MKVNILKIILLVAIVGLSSCGGGGDSGSTTSATVFPRCNFLSDFATLTPTNTPYLAGLALVGNKQPTIVPFDPTGAARHIATQVSSVPTTDGYTSLTGTIAVSSQVSAATGLGAMTVTFSQHVSNGITLNGAAAVQINAVDPYSVSNDKVITLSNFSVTDTYGAITMNGTVREVNDTITTDATTDLSSKLTMNFTVKDGAGHEVEMFDYDYTVFNSGFDGIVYRESYAGKLYDSTYGCATVQTSSSISSNSLIITGLNPQTHRWDPVRSGSISLHNSDGGADAKITVSTSGPATIEVDTTGDGTLDYSLATTWGAI